jgi:hypothetical protein
MEKMWIIQGLAGMKSGSSAGDLASPKNEDISKRFQALSRNFLGQHCLVARRSFSAFVPTIGS